MNRRKLRGAFARIPEMPTRLNDTYPRLVGDIGGTNARFGMIAGPGTQLAQVLNLPCADFPGPREAIEHYVACTGQPRPRWCAFGIANPVDGDAVRMTNHAWAFSIRQLQADLGLARLLVLNDFTALALALPGLGPAELVKVGGGSPVPRRAIGLIGPGTGLGISGLVPCGEHYTAIEGEGGHVTLAACDAREAALIATLTERFPHVSAERVLSGPGLVSLYAAHATLAGRPCEPLTAAEVSARGLAGSCPLCAAALDSFCAMLGTVAADLALMLGAKGGIYIGGGIVPKLGDFFTRSRFRARFEQKGRFSEYLARIPTWVIQAPYPALQGAARALERAEGERG
jgi:glucokinase